ncbi:MAG: HesA/MoeB/ThiF family protein [Bacteroidetes bacterium]|nr:MAG: HesA/MoeB/ThiF family protein [Bacteroidota bacterium]
MSTRYNKHILLEEIGLLGQQSLAEAKVLVVGAGGLGNPLATYLAAMGIGQLGIADGDVVEESNLARQFAFTVQDLGKPKAECLAARLRQNNPAIRIETITSFLSSDNLDSIAADYTLICDCTDNAGSRLLLNSHCATKHKPLFYTAAVGWEAYASLLHGKQGIGLTQLFSEEALRGQEQNCASLGIAAPVCGQIASFTANEVLKWICQLPVAIDGQLFALDGLSGRSRFLKIGKS